MSIFDDYINEMPEELQSELDSLQRQMQHIAEDLTSGRIDLETFTEIAAEIVLEIMQVEQGHLPGDEWDEAYADLCLLWHCEDMGVCDE